MPWRFCVDFPPPTGRICFDIPVLVDQSIFRRPWISVSEDVLDASYVKDLPILATIDTLASDLSNATLRKTLQAAVQEAVKQPAIKGVSINFKGKLKAS